MNKYQAENTEIVEKYLKDHNKQQWQISQEEAEGLVMVLRCVECGKYNLSAGIIKFFDCEGSDVTCWTCQQK